MPIDFQKITPSQPSPISGENSGSAGQPVNFHAQEDTNAFTSRDTVTLSSPQHAFEIPPKKSSQSYELKQKNNEEEQSYEVPDNPLKYDSDADEETVVAPTGQTKPNGELLTTSERMEVADLKHRDKEIRAHEKAHLAAAAAYAQSGATYEYKKGPDGKSYAIHGEVMINSSNASTHQGTIEKMKVVRRAALAPASPSPQDLKVAASASRRMTKAAQQLRLDKLEEAKAEFKQQMKSYEKVEEQIEEEQFEEFVEKTPLKNVTPKKIETHDEPPMKFHVKSYHQSLADIAKYQYNSLELYT